MHRKPKYRKIQTARIVAIYAFFGIAWIYGSDTVLGFFVTDPAIMTRIAVIKGILFIICTATLLYVLINRFAKNLIEAETSRNDLMKEYQIIFNATNEVIFAHDALTGQILEVNNRIFDLFGYTPDEVLTVDIGMLSAGVEPYDQTSAVEMVNKALNEGPQIFDWHCRRKNGELFWSEVSLKRVTIGDYDRIIAVVRDKSERKVYEDRLKLTQFTMDSSTDQIIWTDSTAKIIYANQAVTQILGYSNAELLGMTIHDIAPAFSSSVWSSHWDTLKKVQTLIFEATQQTRSGDTVAVEVCTNYLNHEGQEFTCAYVRDIRGRKEAELERKKMEEQLLHAQKLESIGILAGGIAHDFNNLLTVIVGNIALARTMMNNPERIEQRLADAENALSRASDISRRLLTFAKGGKPMTKPIHLKPLIEESLALVLSGTNVTSTLHIPEHIPPVLADFGQIHQAMSNLIINAVQAMPGGGQIFITAKESTVNLANQLLLPGNYVKIIVADQGTGIPQEVIKQIFDPYFSTKENGTGLGLASTYSIITRHGGSISVTSEPGCGATFEILLKAATKDGEPVAGSSQVINKLPVSCSRPVLIMDDEESIRSVLTDNLKVLGCSCSTAADGMDAIEQYRQAMNSDQPFGVVILDLTVPGGMGGKEAAHRIKEIDPDAKLIVSSGYSDDPVMADYHSYGFMASLPKPYILNDLKKVLQEFMS